MRTQRSGNNGVRCRYLHILTALFLDFLNCLLSRSSIFFRAFLCFCRVSVPFKHNSIILYNDSECFKELLQALFILSVIFCYNLTWNFFRNTAVKAWTRGILTSALPTKNTVNHYRTERHLAIFSVRTGLISR